MVRHVHPSRVALSAVLALGVLLSVGALPASALTQADLPAPLSLMAGSRPYVSTDPATGTTLVVVQSGGVIVGQLYDTDFAAIGAAIPISTGGSVENPSAEWDPENNRWLVVWDDEGDKTVDGRIVAVDGSFLTAELLIADQDLNGETLSDFELAFASYAADQDGYLVAFKATTQTSFCQAAFVSWVATDGTVPTTAATPVSSDDPSVSCAHIDNGADLAYSTTDSVWTVAWFDSATIQTMVRRVGTGATPTLLAAPFPVGANTSGGSADVTYDPTRNRMLIGWHTGGADGDDANGALVSATDVVTPTVIATATPGSAWRRPSLVYTSAEDRYFAVLHDAGSTQAHLVQIDAATGAAEELMLLEADMVRPSISTDGECLWIVWEDNSGDVRGLTTCDSATAPAGPELPPTGTDTAPLAAIGLLALLVGVTGVAASRRRATP
jgi:hypothetical protein